MSKVPSAGLRAWLAALEEDGYAVAKAPDLWGNLVRGGDWDLVVRDLPKAERLLEVHVGIPERVVRRSYVTAFEYPWGHIDLLPGLSWRAVLLAEAPRVIEASVLRADGIRVARDAHQALAACVYPRLAHGSFKEGYRPLLHAQNSGDRAVLRAALSSIFGTHVDDFEEFLGQSPRKLRRQALVVALRKPGGWLRLARFTMSEIRVRGAHFVQHGPGARHWRTGG